MKLHGSSRLWSSCLHVQWFSAKASCCLPGVLPCLRLQINAIFLWNIISYDVQGIHYTSSSNEGSYRDNTVTAMITSHNQWARGAGK
jgi:hypothetical protein